MSDKNKKPKPFKRDGDMITVLVHAESLDRIMIDHRHRKNNQRLGTIRECLAQYGLAMKEVDGKGIIQAPRNRMQLFLEKLHYSGTIYKVVGKEM